MNLFGSEEATEPGFVGIFTPGSQSWLMQLLLCQPAPEPLTGVRTTRRGWDCALFPAEFTEQPPVSGSCDAAEAQLCIIGINDGDDPEVLKWLANWSDKLVAVVVRTDGRLVPAVSRIIARLPHDRICVLWLPPTDAELGLEEQDAYTQPLWDAVIGGLGTLDTSPPRLAEMFQLGADMSSRMSPRALAGAGPVADEL